MRSAMRCCKTCGEREREREREERECEREQLRDDCIKESPQINFEKIIVFFFGERECCLLVLNLVSSTLPCIRRSRPRLRVLDVCGFV